MPLLYYARCALMIIFCALAFLEAGAQPPLPIGDTTRARADSGRQERNVNIGVRAGGPGADIPLTPELERSAYRDPSARALVARARVARATHDSLLQSYEASSVERVSVGARFREAGRDRLAMRGESAAKIRWQRGVGAHIEVQGARTTAPVVSSEVNPQYGTVIGSPSSIPYYPGREALWPMGDARMWKHPLATGAEAYYRYSTGDSIAFRLPGDRTIQLLEIRLEPREPRSDLVGGSFWFDRETAQLVRAIYRPAVPLDLQANIGTSDGNNDAPGWLRPLIITVRSVSVEFGLHEGRWWLPRRQAAQAEAQVTFMRIPVTVEQRFTYSTVNAVEVLPPIVATAPDPVTEPRRAMGDSAWRSLPLEERSRLAREAAEARDRARKETCERSGFTTRVTVRDSVDIQIRVPCDSATLVNSPALPASIFDQSDNLDEGLDRELLEAALGWSSRLRWGLGAPSFHYGVDLIRYNRIEGLSVGAMLRQRFGAGFTAELVGRLGVADLHPRGELTVSRTDAFRTLGISAYERLGVANEWGSPLAFGASLNALIFGRDEGLYYRATGLELYGRGLEGSLFSWRLFGEQHRAVDVETDFSLARLINGNRFPDNIVAERADLLGVGARLQGSLGVDPRGLRLLGDLRAEGATGDLEFARAMLDITLSRALLPRLGASVTAAGGSSTGEVPVQRLWYLGGVHTIRGQPIAAARGDAFWLGRADLGFGVTGLRPGVFYDLGWAGERADWRTPGRPLSGAGVGVSFLDGLIRLDVAKGLRPSRGWRTDLTLEARF